MTWKTRVRIATVADQAAELLRREPLTIRQIAERIGRTQPTVYAAIARDPRFAKTGEHAYERGGPGYWMLVK